MADITKRQSGGYDKEIVLAQISQNNPNRKVAGDHVPEKQPIDAADAEVTDEEEIPEMLSAGDAEVSNHDVPEKQLNDANEDEAADDDVDTEVSDRDIVPETQLNDADAKFAEKDYFGKVVKILRLMYLSLSENVPRLRLGSMDYAYLAYRWGAIPIVANTNAMVTSFLEFLASAGGFLAMFFPVIIIIFLLHYQ